MDTKEIRWRKAKVRLTQLLRKENNKLRQSAVQSFWTVVRLCTKDHGFLHPDLSRAVKAQDFVSLLDIADYLSSQKYDDANTHYVGNQIAYLIKKFPLSIPRKIVDPEAAAFKKFEQSEASCLRMNRLFRLRDLYGRDRDNEFLEKMRHTIQYIIGSAPSLDEVLSEVGFGPGASIGVHGNATNPGRKLLAENWSVTPGAFHLFRASVDANSFLRRALYTTEGGFGLSTLPERITAFQERAKLVNHNKIVFVPKTARIHRSIAVEPLGNGLIQKGVDTVLRRRLRRFGIDLSDQSRNQELARQGSLPDAPDPFVTIDLSSASDSISIGLARRVLPEEWFYLLNSIRSKSYTYKGREATYAKFCSMGNGFCFPLETLLFSAACVAAGSTRPGIDFQVYGDDIIVRQSVAKKVLHILRRIGFKTNTEKTFLEGSFRESCGADWFGGVDVRPYIFDDMLDSVQSVYKFLNATGAKSSWAWFFRDARRFVLRLLVEDARLFRPFPGPDDTCITSSGDEHLRSRYCRYRANGTWEWFELQSVPVADVLVHRVDEHRLQCVQSYAAYGGLDSRKPYTLRRKAKTKVTLTSHSGATSKWLPA